MHCTAVDCKAIKESGAANRKIAPGVEHRSHKGQNNRATSGRLQRFASIHSAIRNCFSVPARRRSALTIRYHRLEAFDAWNALINVG